jgi:hypothetical protein
MERLVEDLKNRYPILMKQAFPNYDMKMFYAVTGLVELNSKLWRENSFDSMEDYLFSLSKGEACARIVYGRFKDISERINLIEE